MRSDDRLVQPTGAAWAGRSPGQKRKVKKIYFFLHILTTHKTQNKNYEILLKTKKRAQRTPRFFTKIQHCKNFSGGNTHMTTPKDKNKQHELGRHLASVYKVRTQKGLIGTFQNSTDAIVYADVSSSEIGIPYEVWSSNVYESGTEETLYMVSQPMTKTSKND